MQYDQGQGPADGDLVGKLFAGRFHLEGLLGVGGMGAVYRARHDVLQRRLAVKVIRRELAGDTGIVQRFRREARAASRIQHPNVVEIVDFGYSDGGQPYLAMELVEGEPLDRVLRRDGPFPVERALGVLAAVASALHAAHLRGVIHRDLKPRNIILSSAPQQDFVKVLDFGLAKLVGGDVGTYRLTEAGEIFGTPEYMAPEHCLDGDVDARSDIYSLGVLAFELLAGEPPFRGSPVQIIMGHVEGKVPALAELRDDLPAPVEALVTRCLAKDPQARFQSGEEFARAVEVLVGTPRRGTNTFGSPTEPVLAAALEPSVGSAAETLPPRAARVDALEELAFALRDRRLGDPQLSYGLAMLFEAHERRLEAEHGVWLAEAQLEARGQGLRRRELVLEQVLAQLLHELEELAGPQDVADLRDTMPTVEPDPEERWATRSLLDACVRNIEARLREISKHWDRQRGTIERELQRYRDALEQTREEEQQRAGELEERVLAALAEAHRPGEDLLALCRRAGLERR